MTEIIVTEGTVKNFSKNNFNILTTEENFEGQRFAILAMFLLDLWDFLISGEERSLTDHLNQ